MYAKIVAGVLTAVLLGTSVGWAQDSDASWARYFSLEWNAAQAKGQPVIKGYITNNHLIPADRIRLLIEVLDSSGRVVASTVGYVDEWVPPRGRGYFYTLVPGPAGGASYRVAVHSWSWRFFPGHSFLRSMPREFSIAASEPGGRVYSETTPIADYFPLE